MRTPTLIVLSSTILLASCQENFQLNMKKESTSLCVKENLPFGYGDGTSTNPYLICTKEHFQNIGTSMSSHYALDTDLDFQGSSYTPIGVDDLDQFLGSLEGNNKTIKNIIHNDPADAYAAGLFRSIGVGASVKNLKLKMNFTGNNIVGGLAGQAQGATLENITVEGNIKGNATVGGIVGHVLAGDLFITSPVVKGTITSTATGSRNRNTATATGFDCAAAGVVGTSIGAGYSEIIDARVEANITWDTTGPYQASGWVFASGIAGYIGGRVENAYYKGTVKGSHYLAGLVSYLHTFTNTRSGIFNSFVDNAVIEGTGNYLGGVTVAGYPPAGREVFAQNIVLATLTTAGRNVGGLSAAGCGIYHYRSFAKVTATGTRAVAAGLGSMCVNGVYDSFVTGTVTATDVVDQYNSVAGMGASGWSTCAAERSYADVVVNAPNATAGHIAASAVKSFGNYYCAATVADIYYRSSVSAWGDAYATGLNDADMVDQNAFSGFDFSSSGAWRMPISNPLMNLNSPVLAWMCGKHGIVCPP